MDIWFASNNTHKKEELEAILNKKLKSPLEEGFDFNPEETGNTFFDNALIKARALYELPVEKSYVIADDSGLCVDALGGRPCVLSARYGMEKIKHSPESKDRLTSKEQNLLLLDELGDNPLRAARFVCSMVLLLDNNRFIAVQETIEGEIVKRSGMKGEGGFGYDPIFFIKKFGRTLAEISSDEKNKISHRAKAGKIIADYLQ